MTKIAFEKLRWKGGVQEGLNAEGLSQTYGLSINF